MAALPRRGAQILAGGANHLLLNPTGTEPRQGVVGKWTSGRHSVAPAGPGSDLFPLLVVGTTG